jgi:hypothetical protein
MSSKSPKRELAVITEDNRPHILEWLRDRSAFHSWFSSLVTGSFVVITVFGSKPDFSTVSGRVLSIALVLLLFALVCNLVCVWSIPSWKYRVSTGIVTDSSAMRRELAITAWLGVIAFVSGLTVSIPRQSRGL